MPALGLTGVVAGGDPRAGAGQGRGLALGALVLPVFTRTSMGMVPAAGFSFALALPSLGLVMEGLPVGGAIDALTLALVAGKEVLAGALLATLALRLPFLTEPLGVDEGGLAYIARFWTGGRGHSLYGDYWIDRPPLLLALFKAAGAGGAVGIRVLGALAAIALVVVPE